MLPTPTHIPPQFPPSGALPDGSIPPPVPSSSAPGRPLFPIQNQGAPGYAPPGGMYLWGCVIECIDLVVYELCVTFVVQGYAD
jgi:hypothetical protein